MYYMERASNRFCDIEENPSLSQIYRPIALNRVHLWGRCALGFHNGNVCKGNILPGYPALLAGARSKIEYFKRYCFYIADILFL